MIQIRPIAPHEWEPAKRLIYIVAKEIFHDPRPLDEIIAYYSQRGAFSEMTDIRSYYFDNAGTFLVAEENGGIIGTGAIGRIDDETCELKRLWFLTRYHGQGLGYRMIEDLFAFARAQRYKKVRLETSPVSQKRAYELYKRIGFREIPLAHSDPEDVFMEMDL